MALTTRQKVGIGTAATGALGILAGVVLFVTKVTPEWVPVVINIIALVLGSLGFKITIPSTSGEG